MNRLSFENVDVVNTPLSSLRSCSEYQKRIQSLQGHPVPAPSDTDSFWSFLSWNFFTQKKKKNRVRFAEDTSHREFLVEHLRFNADNLVDGEDYDYSRDRCRSASKSVDRGRLVSVSDRPGKGKSFAQEASWLMDYVFGINIGPPPPQVMEIELRLLKPPQLLAVFDESQPEHASETAPRPEVGLRRVTSLRSLERIPEDTPRPSRSNSSGSGVSMGAPEPPPAWERARQWLRARHRPDEAFYECIRIQPFSSGAYLRGMLLAGTSALCFQTYHLATWPAPASWPLRALLAGLCLQVLLGLLAMPSRLRIQHLCWESSRAVEVDAAITLIRGMLRSDAWILNQALGRAADALALANLAATEAFLCLSAEDDPARQAVVSLCATNLLGLGCRCVLATLYSLSLHDPAVLAEARRRGLSKWDLDILPAFVFSRREEVTNADCSICLAGFSLGEMLISLPCDRKHSFHAACIRQWLRRQNSCPLCQKLV